MLYAKLNQKQSRQNKKAEVEIQKAEKSKSLYAQMLQQPETES
jgi:hypothetical protein